MARQARVALDHAVLHLDGAAHGIDYAAELDEAPVAGALHCAAMMRGDGGIDQIAPQPAQPRQRPLLVGPGKLAESDHIRRKKAASFRVSAMAVRSSSEPASLLYPATSAARMAASLRVSGMAALSPQGRVAQIVQGLVRGLADARSGSPAGV
jgi:hypothetical protein